jgi:hypothetical protein
MNNSSSINHNGYYKIGGKYYVMDCNGNALEVAPHKIAQLEMIRKDGLKS